jgi:hypothetical protein
MAMARAATSHGLRCGFWNPAAVRSGATSRNGIWTATRSALARQGDEEGGGDEHLRA